MEKLDLFVMFHICLLFTLMQGDRNREKERKGKNIIIFHTQLWLNKPIFAFAFSSQLMNGYCWKRNKDEKNQFSVCNETKKKTATPKISDANLFEKPKNTPKNDQKKWRRLVLGDDALIASHVFTVFMVSWCNSKIKHGSSSCLNWFPTTILITNQTANWKA